MPMRWTAGNDNILFLKILESNNFSVNTQAISKSWPTENENERPTPRAISERIFRLKQKAKQVISASNPSTPLSKPVTPRARNSGRGRHGGGSVSTKRKKEPTPEDDSDPETVPVSRKRVKKEHPDEEVSMAELEALEMSTPSRRSRKPVQYLNMAKYVDSDDNGNRSDSSAGDDNDFKPEEESAVFAEKVYHPSNEMFEDEA